MLAVANVEFNSLSVFISFSLYSLLICTVFATCLENVSPKSTPLGTDVNLLYVFLMFFLAMSGQQVLLSASWCFSNVLCTWSRMLRFVLHTSLFLLNSMYFFFMSALLIGLIFTVLISMIYWLISLFLFLNRFSPIIRARIYISLLQIIPPLLYLCLLFLFSSSRSVHWLYSVYAIFIF